MGDHGTTPVHQQQCNDNTIIIVNIPQLAGENNTSHIQLLPQDVSGVCPMTSQQYSTTFTSIQPHQQQQISGTIAANTQSSQENSQCYAKEELDGLILNQQDLMTARTVNYSSSALIFDRTASVRSDMSPAEEMSLEVTQITSPADGYFSRENIRRVHQHSLQSGLVHAMSRSESPSLPTDQARQRAGQITGFSTPPPSVPQMKLDFSKEDSSSLDASDDCYFSRDVTVHQTDPAVRAGRTVARSQQKIAVLTSKRLHTVTRVSSTTGQCLVGAVPSPTDSRVVNISDPSKVSSCSHTRENTSQPRHICVVAAGAHSQVSEAVSRYHRPQYSYLHLIQMAISSTPDKQMTLKQIYRWIEDNFLYYSYTPNQGWKNSIRHNLSLYDIFVRKKPSDDSKKRTSYWTLRLDVPLKSSKACRQQANNETPLSKGLTTTADTVQSSTVATPGSAARVQLSTALKTIMPGSNFSTSRQKKGPVPLLPKVSPMQAFALIPIQGAVMSPQPFLLSSWPVGSHHLTSTPSLSSRVQQTPSNTGVLPSIPQSLTGLKRNLEPCGEPCKKQVKIAPKLDKCGTTRSVSNMCSITRSACTPCQNQTVDCVTSRTLSSSNLHKSLRLRSASASELTPKAVVTRCHVTPRIMRQRRGSLSGIATNQSSFEDSGFDVSCHKADSSCSVSLPRPRMYRRKCSLKHSGTMYENQNDGIVSKCQRDHSISDLDSAIHSVGDALPLTPHRKTSTPFKESVCSPSWISPIKELTPLSGVSSHFDSGCFFTPDSATKPLCSALPCRADITDLYNSPKLHQGTCSIGIEGSPKLGSLRSLGMPGLTPLKSSTDAVVICSPNTSWSGGLNHSFTRLFDDCHLNPIIDDEINMDFSFSTLL